MVAQSSLFSNPIPKSDTFFTKEELQTALHSLISNLLGYRKEHPIANPFNKITNDQSDIPIRQYIIETFIPTWNNQIKPKINYATLKESDQITNFNYTNYIENFVSEYTNNNLQHPYNLDVAISALKLTLNFNYDKLIAPQLN